MSETKYFECKWLVNVEKTYMLDELIQLMHQSGGTVWLLYEQFDDQFGFRYSTFFIKVEDSPQLRDILNLIFQTIYHAHEGQCETLPPIANFLMHLEWWEDATQTNDYIRRKLTNCLTDEEMFLEKSSAVSITELELPSRLTNLLKPKGVTSVANLIEIIGYVRGGGLSMFKELDTKDIELIEQQVSQWVKENAE